MSRSISFIPSAHAPDPPELTYVEQASRHRSIHLLMQDTGPSRTASRERFLRNAYREVVSRYMSMGKIEHPVPLLRGIIAYLDALSTRVDSRVSDFDGLAFYVLVQDGNTSYLLASRGTGTSLRRAGRFLTLGTNEIPGVRELPVESVSSQQELFSKSIPDFLALYRIEFEEGEDIGLAVILGGTANECGAVVDMLESPAGVGVSSDARIPVGLLRQPVLYVDVERAPSSRLEPLVPTKSRFFNGSRVGGNVLALVSVVLIVGSLATVWISQWVGKDPAIVQRVEGASESPDRLRESQTPVATEIPLPVAIDSRDEEMAEMEMSVSWQKEYKKPVTGSPVIDGDVVFFGGRDGNFYALNRSGGGVKWQHEIGAGIGSSPVTTGDHVVVCDYDGGVTALDRRTGKPAWSRTLPDKIVSTPSISGGEVLVGCMNGIAYALSLETGRVLWEFRTKGSVRASIAAKDDRFYVPSYDGSIYCVKRGTGKLIWRHQTDGRVSSSPAVGDEGIVLGTAGGEVILLDADTGEPRWRFKARFAVSSFVRLEGGRVFVGSDGGDFYCLDASDGELLWDFSAKSGVFARAYVYKKRVYVASYDQFIYCLDARTGKELGRFDAGGAIYSSPVGADGVIYFGNNEGVFYCVALSEKRAS